MIYEFIHLYHELIWGLEQTLTRGMITSSNIMDPLSSVNYTWAYAVNLSFVRCCGHPSSPIPELFTSSEI